MAGHGGSRAAEYLKQHLFENLMKHPQFMTDTRLAISAFMFLLQLTFFFFGAANLWNPFHLLFILIEYCRGRPIPILVVYFILFQVNFIWWVATHPGETYKQTDKDFLDAEKDTFRDDGSTASTAVLVGNRLYVANVGDSRAVISKAGKGYFFSIFEQPRSFFVVYLVQ